jgi:hypothetical protein
MNMGTILRKGNTGNELAIIMNPKSRVNETPAPQNSSQTQSAQQKSSLFLVNVSKRFKTFHRIGKVLHLLDFRPS